MNEIVSERLGIAQAPAKQQPTFKAVVLAKTDRQPRPFIKPRTFCAFTSGQGCPGVRVEVFRQGGGIGLNKTIVFKKSQRMVRACGQDISLTAISSMRLTLESAP